MRAPAESKSSDSKKERWIFPLIVIPAILVGAMPRYLLLYLTESRIDSDEAIVGLMAKHITEGRPWPIFYYGQHYMGSLESILMALWFSLLGRSDFGVKAIPLIFSLLLIPLIYLLARRYTTRFGAFVAAFLCALGPSALIEWSSKARGGFIELVFIGTAALIIAVDLLKTDRPKIGAFLALGLILGVGWWVNNQIVFYMAAIGAVFVIHFPMSYGFRKSVAWGLSAVLTFVIGSSPFWYANLFQSPRFQTFAEIGGHAKSSEALQYLGGFFTTALPIIMGARRFWTNTDLFIGATAFAYLLYGSAVLYLVYRLLVSMRRSKLGEEATEAPNCSMLLLLLVFCLFVPAIFSMSSFGWLSQAPRYLLPMYSVLFVAAGTFVGALAGERGQPLQKVVAIIVLAGFLGLHLASNYLSEVAIPGEPVVYAGERVSADHRPLYAWLEANGYRHIHTNYWIGYRVAFETGERVTFTRFHGPLSLRIPEYERNAPDSDSSVYVLVPAEARGIAENFALQGLNFRTTRVGQYVVIDHVVPEVEVGQPIEIKPEAVRATSRSDWVPALVDHNRGSRWGSGAPQAPGMEIVVDLPKGSTVSAVELDYGFWPQDAPRGLIIEGKDTAGNWCELFDSGEKEAFFLDPDQAMVYFKPRELQAIRVIETGSHPVLDWSIAELVVYAPGNITG